MTNNNNNNNNRIADIFDYIPPILLTIFRSSSFDGNYYYHIHERNGIRYQLGCKLADNV